MTAVTSLGHVGVYVSDLDRMRDFYRDVLGLTLTDQDDRAGMVFLSAQPDTEHHELLLASGRRSPEDALVLQQVSFRCGSLEDLREIYGRVRDRARIDMVVSHGNAVGVYFFDPEGNRCEVYWQTGLRARQPFLQAVDLDAPSATTLAAVHEMVDRYGETGYVDPALLARQGL